MPPKNPRNLTKLPRSEQQPLNEYLNLKQSWCFRWTTLEWRHYLFHIVWIWCGSWCLASPIATESFPPTQSPGKFVIATSAGASLVLALNLLWVYLGWSYICDRLERKTVYYEETGWYDGQFWTKSSEELVKDRLIATYQVKPILQRLRRTFEVQGLFLLSGYLVWNFL
ncbi:CGLD27 family protein [Pleurocapsales cyanobacterium LEGE 06147]|nr:CGLD27 family protein [Pleurocapsales cyanobacterium LEGE 06147]